MYTQQCNCYWELNQQHRNIFGHFPGGNYFFSHSNMHISNNHHHHHHSKCCWSENFSRPYNPGMISDFRQDTSCHSDDYNYIHCSFMRKQHVHVTTSQQPVFWGDDSSGSAAPQDRSMKSVCPESRLWVHTEDNKYCTSQEVTKEKEESWFMCLYFIFPALSHFLLHLGFLFLLRRDGNISSHVCSWCFHFKLCFASI